MYFFSTFKYSNTIKIILRHYFFSFLRFSLTHQCSIAFSEELYVFFRGNSRFGLVFLFLKKNVLGYHSFLCCRNKLFYCSSLYCALQILCFLQIEGLWQPYVSLSTDTIFPILFVHIMSLCHILEILAIFHTFSLLVYLLR